MRKLSFDIKEIASAIASDPILVLPLLIVMVLCGVLGAIAWFRFG